MIQSSDGSSFFRGDLMREWIKRVSEEKNQLSQKRDAPEVDDDDLMKESKGQFDQDGESFSRVEEDMISWVHSKN